jgi:hypothetical protein
VQRVLRPGGTLILNLDVGHAPTATEPHTLTAAAVREALGGMTVERQLDLERAHGEEGHPVVLVATRR